NFKKAEANYQMARDAVDRFYTRVSQDRLLNEPHMDRLRRELLELARDFYQKFADQRRADPRSRDDLGRALLRLSNIVRAIGSDRERLPRAEEPLVPFPAWAAAQPKASAYRDGLAMSHQSLGILYARTGRPKEAEGALERAVEGYEALAAAHP